MPQVDLASVCGGGADRKIACETTLPDDGHPPTDEQINHEQQPHEPPQADFPPESFCISREEELDWIDQNAYIERKDSAKGSTVSHSANLNPNIHPTSSSTSASQRYSSTNLKSKPSIIGLPKPQKAAYAEAKFRHHCRPANIHLFPKRSDRQPTGAGKAAVTVLEPSSPKVSCMGRVKSRKERSRRKKNEQQRRKQQGGDQPSMKRSKSSKNHKAGFWTNFRSMFRPKGRKSAAGGNNGDEVDVKEKERKKSVKKSRSVKRRQFAAAEEEEMEPALMPPNLGGMNRFTSGRRSAAWAGELEIDGAKSEPLDRSGSIWQRRSVGPLDQVHVDRRWQAVGPISV